MANEKPVWLEDALAAAKTDKEREQVLRDYEAQKLAEAERREQARFESPTMIDKFMRGIKSLKNKIQKKRNNNHTLPPQQHSR